MTLAALETAVVEYVGDVLVNDCGRPVPDRVLRYHGIVPHDCCTEKGLLVVSWEPQRSATVGQARTPCQSVPPVHLLVRYVVCWKVPEAGPNGIVLADATWDADAGVLADVAECVTRALVRLTCTTPNDDNPFVAAVLDLVADHSIAYIDTTPITPLGGCAGITWRLAATLRPSEPVS